jgi:hypothetical protein
MSIIARADNFASGPPSTSTKQLRPAPNRDLPVARRLSDFKKIRDPFVRAASHAFWQAVQAEALPGQKNHMSSVQ